MNFDDRIAEVVGNYPAIWDKRSKDYKNSIMKENAYKRISEIVNCPVEVAIARFKFLREKYRKEKHKILNATRSGAGALPFKPWYLLGVLQFLDTVQVTRKMKGSMPWPESQVQPSMPQNVDELEHSVECSFTEDSAFNMEYEWIQSESEGEGEAIPIATPKPIINKMSKTSNIASGRLSFSSSPSGSVTATPDPPYSVVASGKRNKKSRCPIEVEDMLERLVSCAEKPQVAVTPKSPTQFEAFGIYVAETLTKMSENEVRGCL